MAENIKDLFEKYAHPGKLEFIGIRSAKRAPVESQDNASITVEEGLVGDHYSGKSRQRQVTLIQAEHLKAVGDMLQKKVDPFMTRRNLVVSGINLLSLSDRKFKIGSDVILQTTGPCQPCSRMEENLGLGGYNAMRGHGGITATVIQGGAIRVGDDISYLPDQSSEK